MTSSVYDDQWTTILSEILKSAVGDNRLSQLHLKLRMVLRSIYRLHYFSVVRPTVKCLLFYERALASHLYSACCAGMLLSEQAKIARMRSPHLCCNGGMWVGNRPDGSSSCGYHDDDGAAPLCGDDRNSERTAALARLLPAFIASESSARPNSSPCKQVRGSPTRCGKLD
jgi:hypothetical protein